MQMQSEKRIFVILQVIIAVSGFCFAHAFGVYDLSAQIAVLVALDLLAGLILVQMTYSIRSEDILGGNNSVQFMRILAATSIYLFLDEMAWLVDGRADLIFWNYFMNAGFFMGGVILLWMYWFFINDWTNVKSPLFTRVLNVVVSVQALLIAGSIPFGYFFTVLPDGTYQRSATYPLALVIPVIVICIITGALIKRPIPGKERLILLLFPAAPVVVTLTTVFSTGTIYTGTAVFFSVMTIYTNLYTRKESEIVEHQVLLKQQEVYLAKQEKELEHSKLEVTRLQMNPHFIYNTLGSAAELCMTDPAGAEDFLILFSKYLRGSFGEMSDQAMVPFAKEIEYLENYLVIEKVRFPDMVVEMNFRVIDFELPGLTLQPIVENAIRHGIRGKRQGGKIRILSFQNAEEYTLIVEDDGVGYQGIPDDGKKHIGIANVRYRLEKICGGTLEIHGEKGRGTVAEIRIPKIKRDTNS